MASIPDSPLGVSSSRLALVDRFPPTTYTGLKDLNKLTVARRDQLYQEVEGVSQYLSVKDVSSQQFDYIVEREEGLSGHVRLNYFRDIETLVVKIPARETEQAHANFWRIVNCASDRMGVDLEEACGLGATTFWGPTGSAKEADSSFTNLRIRSSRQWPIWVIEAAIRSSDSMLRLRAAAAWWAAHSAGDVKLVFLIEINRETKEVMVEQHVPVRWNYPNTRSHSRSGAGLAWKASRVSTVTIRTQGVDSPTIQGGPLVLKFESVFERAPNPPLEQDIVISETKLLKWVVLFSD
ncbi:hypothetical protein BO86DRAFT_374451 [Aspergillus japonicus CBS 114.51]|uniref:Uncharacterized protein n=1 Tax=Aspergillus japonicus CBS 114.51 TaxID=1448312 RepID=A0A8T8XIS3_ASPJA|nr:hypothetical protein BO86DRAFT_374451 [Aspergillus japonicus CBS 114.51]RAH87422.1 hypothetical protein BO86DRAFT_374451 [Aspergillus japonicus CBS 114.51]